MKKKVVIKNKFMTPIVQRQRNFYNPMGYWDNAQGMSFSQMPSFVKLPLFGFKKPEVPKQPDKNLSYPQAKQKFGLAPFGNWDKDYHLNVFDCRPFDITKHKVSSQLKDRPVTVTGRPDMTFGKVFEEAEQKIPKIWKQGGGIEDTYSNYLEQSLLKRQELLHNEHWEALNKVYRDIVGVYKVTTPLDIVETKYMVDEIGEYLEKKYPDLDFEFNLEDPNHVTVYEPPKRVPMYDKYITNAKGESIPDIVGGAKVVMDEHGKPRYAPPKTDKYGEVIMTKKEGVRLANYIDERTAPVTVNMAMKGLKGVKEITFVITENPSDILQKSAYYKPDGTLAWASCETFKPIHPRPGEGICELGPFSDIEQRNAIAWIYYEGKEPKKDPPSARTMIRWGIDENGVVDVGIEEKSYPKESAESDAIATAIRKKLVKKGYTVRDIKQIFTSTKAYLDNMHQPYIKERIARHFGVSKRDLPSEQGWYRGIANPQFYIEESPQETRRKYLERESRIPLPIGLRLVRSPEQKEHDMDSWISDISTLARKDVPLPVLKKLTKHPSEVVKSAVAKREYKQLTGVPMSQEKWENLSPSMMFTLGKKDQPSRVKADLLFSGNPLPEELKEQILSSKNVAKRIFESSEDTYPLSDKVPLVKKLLSIHKSPDIKKSFINSRLREEWYPWAIPLLLEDGDSETVSDLIYAHGSSLPKNVLLQICSSDNANVKNSFIERFNLENLDSKCIYALLTKGAHLSDEDVSRIIRNADESHLDLKITKAVIGRKNLLLLEQLLKERLHHSKLGLLDREEYTSERNEIWKMILKSDIEINDEILELILMDSYMSPENVQLVLAKYSKNPQVLYLLFTYILYPPSKHVLFQHVKTSKYTKNEKIRMYERLLSDLNESDALYNIIKKELLRLKTRT